MIKREKRRYLALKVEYKRPLDERAILYAIQASVNRLFGEYGASQAKIKQIKYFPEKQQLIIRCSHNMLDKVKAAITSIIEINGENAAIHVFGVSGTLKALSKKT
ncbi:Rpp14/Pop5 family protein [Thermoproteota archaeon]